MRKTLPLLTVMMLITCVLFSSCGRKSDPELPVDDPTQFSRSSIVGIWACIGSSNTTYDILTGEYTYDWDYDPNAETYDVYWYFDIQSNSRVKYINVEEDEWRGEYRKSDGYLHISEDSEWSTMIDANYIFDVEHQAIRCTSGTVLGFKVESVEDFLGTDTIFYVKRYGLDEAAIIDNTGWIDDQYVVRVKGIKKDL